jgi:hypothetical protein
MFRKSTVFVLGAGASWHYGYPTGEDLVERVYEMAGRLEQQCQLRAVATLVLMPIPKYIRAHSDNEGIAGVQAGWRKAGDDCRQLRARLRAVKPLLIDSFLAWNKSLQEIGKLVIALVILECEATWLRDKCNQNRKLSLINSPTFRDVDIEGIKFTKYRDDWVRFIVHKLVYGCKTSEDIFHNYVSFVTFNYDTSLEYNLYEALNAIQMIEKKHIELFLGGDRIVHVYGSVHSCIPDVNEAVDIRTVAKLGEVPQDQEEIANQASLLDYCYESSKYIRTVDPTEKDDTSKVSAAKHFIEDAEIVYILGYGFDSNNNRRIGIDSINQTKKIMFTNFGNQNTINKTAGHLFCNSYGHFIREEFVAGHPGQAYYVEKSVRNVYEALEKDFYALETEELR